MGTSPLGSSGGSNAPPGNEKKKKKKGKAGTEGPVTEEAQICCGCRFPLLVALLQLLLGIAIAGVAFLMVAISSSLLARETPHWAGIIVSNPPLHHPYPQLPACLVCFLGAMHEAISPVHVPSAKFISILFTLIACMFISMSIQRLTSRMGEFKRRI